MKNQIRKEMKERRAALNSTEAATMSTAAAMHLLESEIYKNSVVLMLYMPLGNETDTKEIMNLAFRDGKRVVLPVTCEKTGIITPYFYTADTILEKGGFSVIEPKNAKLAEKTEIDTVVVPGIAFDKYGSRVGFGKGCYDMFLNGMNAVKIGYCYDFQLVDEIPFCKHDIQMDFIATEKGMIECKY